MKSLILFFWGWGRRRRVDRIVHEALSAVETERRGEFAKLLKQLRELRSAYIERYDEDQGSGLPARQARLEARLDGLRADITEFLQRIAQVEIALAELAKMGGYVPTDRAVSEHYKELAASNPGLTPYAE